MKILLLNQTFYPDQFATSQQLTDLALYLVDRGCEVSVMADSRSYENREKRFMKYEEYKKIKIHRVYSTGFGKKSVFRRVVDSLVFDIFVIIKLLSFPKQDVVISFTSPPLVGILGALFCCLKGGKSVSWLMDINPDAAINIGYIKRGSIRAKLLSAVLNFELKSNYKTVVLDRWMKKKITEHGINENKITIVPPWTALKKETETTKGDQFRRVNKLENKFIILYSGNHSVVHPLDTVLEAANKNHNDENTVFIFAGGGLRTLDVAAYKKKHGLKNIIQLEFQPEQIFKDMMMAADIHLVVMGPNMSGLVHPSKIYGIMQTGKPFIYVGEDESHVVDIIRESGNGIQVRHGDSEGMLRAIEEIKKQIKNERSEKKSKQYSNEKYSSEVQLKRVAEEVLGIKSTQSTKNNLFSFAN